MERFGIGVLAAVVSMALFAFVAHNVAAGGTRRLDTAVVAFFDSHRSNEVATLMQGISLLASGWAQTAIAVVCLFGVWCLPSVRPFALSLLVAIGGGEGLVYGLKALFHRARPAEIYVHLGYSFPSGHSFFAVILYGMVACWLTRARKDSSCLPWVWPVAVPLILLIGFSRVYLGVHYPSDVLAGFAAAVPWLWACLALPGALSRLQRSERHR